MKSKQVVYTVEKIHKDTGKTIDVLVTNRDNMVANYIQGMSESVEGKLVSIYEDLVHVVIIRSVSTSVENLLNLHAES